MTLTREEMVEILEGDCARVHQCGGSNRRDQGANGDRAPGTRYGHLGGTRRAGATAQLPHEGSLDKRSEEGRCLSPQASADLSWMSALAWYGRSRDDLHDRCRHGRLGNGE